MTALALIGFVSAFEMAAQVLPPARDGDIRTVFWALQNRTEVWLTIEPRSVNGTPAPPTMILTFTREFAGTRPDKPATDATAIDVRAYAGLMWAPRTELSFVVDGEKMTPVVDTAAGLISGGGSDYLPATITLSALKRLAAADDVRGDALGFQFVFTDTQRSALRTFAVRAASADPSRADPGDRDVSVCPRAAR